MTSTQKVIAVPLVAAALTSFFASASVGMTSTAPVCSSAVRKETLPVWARAGFHPATQRVPYVLGRSGTIVAILFGYPLTAPPPVTRNNKILWVSRTPVESLTRLRISAQRMAGTRPLGKPVRRSVAGGPGPSIINLPAPGCWRLSLSWAGRDDTLDLQYRPGEHG
jgi:hypothetical protein